MTGDARESESNYKVAMLSAGDIDIYCSTNTVVGKSLLFL